MSAKHKTQQKSKLARANNKLSKMIDRYYALNFDIVSIRKEINSDSIFSNQISLSQQKEAKN